MTLTTGGRGTRPAQTETDTGQNAGSIEGPKIAPHSGFLSLPVVPVPKWRMSLCGLSGSLCCVALPEVLVGDCLLNKNGPQPTLIADSIAAKWHLVSGHCLLLLLERQTICVPKKEEAVLASVQVDYAKIEEHPAGGDRLFKVMMRLEFALKEIGYCRAVRNQAAEVDWDRFANERLGRSFFDEIKASGNASILIQHPPKLQSIDGQGRLDWVEKSAVSSIQELVGSLRRVRNNLFHGGKSGDTDRDRNVSLVRDALFAVEAILLHDDDLRMMFEGNY